MGDETDDEAGQGDEVGGADPRELGVIAAQGLEPKGAHTLFDAQQNVYASD